MTDEMFKAVLETVGAKLEKDGASTMPEGRTMTLYAAHDGVGLTVGKIERVEQPRGLVRARNVKGETFLLALEDVFAAAIEGGGQTASGRKAGFLG